MHLGEVLRESGLFELTKFDDEKFVTIKLYGYHSVVMASTVLLPVAA